MQRVLAVMLLGLNLNPGWAGAQDPVTACRQIDGMNSVGGFYACEKIDNVHSLDCVHAVSARDMEKVLACSYIDNPFASGCVREMLWSSSVKILACSHILSQAGLDCIHKTKARFLNEIRACGENEH